MLNGDVGWNPFLPARHVVQTVAFTSERAEFPAITTELTGHPFRQYIFKPLYSLKFLEKTFGAPIAVEILVALSKGSESPPDYEGMDFPSVEAAINEAKSTAGEMAREAIEFRSYDFVPDASSLRLRTYATPSWRQPRCLSIS